MIEIVYQANCAKIARRIASDLKAEYANRFTAALHNAAIPIRWPKESSWDDILIVVFDGKAFPQRGNESILNYRKERSKSAMLLPVAIDPEAPRPPRAIEDIKALTFDKNASGPKGRLAKRVGAMLGLRVQGRDCKPFVSYRAIDGTLIANQVFNHLKNLGYKPFLDEAKELDGETTILPGSPVQVQIDKALGEANLLLLIDTPAAPQSLWIKHEIDTADSLLLPILPVCLRSPDDRLIGPRFQSLLALQRWIPFPLPATPRRNPLTQTQLDQVVSELETYLCEILRRKCRIPELVAKEFKDRGFAWNTLNERLLMYRSSRSTPRLITRILSHCSIFDRIYPPAMTRFLNFLDETDRHNFSLFIYDGEVQPDFELRKLAEAQNGDVIILHHQELATLIDSNFTVLGRS